jgi:hypothetical protein
LPFAAAIEQQYAIAVASEQARVRDRAAAAGGNDDRGTVARRHVPADEAQPVRGHEAHALIRTAEIGCRYRLARSVRGDDRDRHRQQYEKTRRAGEYGQQRPSRVPTERALVASARAPQRPYPQCDEQGARQRSEHGSDVVAGEPVDHDVANSVGHAGGDREDAADDGSDAAQPRPQPRIGERERDRYDQRHQSGQQMVACRGPQLGMQEGVVDERHHDDRHRAAEHMSLA